ncbi:hypothetical protein GCM10009559_56360 [Pseudonocardia zijingensis]|uniref:Uncharacterized protein n=1 Tax=Pseudonocardia zijingensis TaxID=153376 RepID=A0ABN1N813_9PSEU
MVAATEARQRPSSRRVAGAPDTPGPTRSNFDEKGRFTCALSYVPAMATTGAGVGICTARSAADSSSVVTSGM